VVYFFPKKDAADCFTVKIRQIKRSDMVTFLFSVHIITKKKGRRSQGEARAVDLPTRSFDLARPGVAPPLLSSPTSFSLLVKRIQ